MFSDVLSLSDDKIVLGRSMFAMQLHDIHLSNFKGHTFYVDHGSVEKITSSEENLADVLKTSSLLLEQIPQNSTAAVQITADLFEAIPDHANTKIRLSYVVFKSDSLFMSVNQTGEIVSVVVTVRQRGLENVTLPNPVTLTLRTLQQVHVTNGIPHCSIKFLILCSLKMAAVLCGIHNLASFMMVKQ